MRLFLLLLVLLPNFARAAQSNIFVSRRDTVSLISQTETAAGGRIQLALRFNLTRGWHIYWQNPGDAGLPPEITLDGAAAGPFTYPPPQFLLQDGVAAYVLSENVILPFTATGIGRQISGSARWLVCQNICVPEHARFSLTLAGDPSLVAENFPPPQIASSPFAAHVSPDGTLTLAGATATQIQSARFFPFAPGAIVNAAPQPLHFTAGGLALGLTPGPNFSRPLAGLLELTDPSGVTQALAVTAAPGPAATPLIVWLVFAFLGGILLNLMPCVFPVLALKIFGLIRLGGTSRRAAWAEAGAYTAGILATMLLLAGVLLGLRALGGGQGWGFEFQSPVFLALLTWLIFGAGLSLAGAFAANFSFGRVNLPGGSFFNGVLAVAVATPCTAPFMAGAVAAALAAPPAAALGIFLCLGLGLAAPFLLIAAIPAFGRLLPRPGAWMITLQRLLSLPMFATALWLAWVMRHEAGPTGLAFLLLGAACLALALSLRRLRPLALAALLPLVLLRPAAGAALTLPGAEPFTPAKLAALRAARQPVLVDITAAWCITCLVNERTALAVPTTRAALASTHTSLLVGDWTSRDNGITAYLAANNREGVPLYVFYPISGAPRILPQLLTANIVKAALTAPTATAQTPAPGG